MTEYQKFVQKVGEDGLSRYVRTEEEKERRRAESQSSKIMKEKRCQQCGKSYTPKFQHGTKRWEQSMYCSASCNNKAKTSTQEYKDKKNAKRRGDSELHRREYEMKIERRGGTLWQVGTPEERERVRERNRRRYARLYGTDKAYTADRKANAAAMRGKRRNRKKELVLTPDEQECCKNIRIKAQELSERHGVLLHVDHILPMRRGGYEHPDNLLIMTAAANLFWGAKIKRCPWPKPHNWDEPAWEL